jgi:hypothetical protein
MVVLVGVGSKNFTNVRAKKVATFRSPPRQSQITKNPKVARALITQSFLTPLPFLFT